MKYFKKIDIKLVKGKYKNPIKDQLKYPKQIYDIFKSIKDKNQEILIGIYLDDNMNTISYDILSVGGENIALVLPEEIFMRSYLTRCKIFMLVHNHPSGNPTPSKQDKEVIEIIKKQSKILNRFFLDFIIIGDMDASDKNKNYWSMFEEENGDNYINVIKNRLTAK